MKEERRRPISHGLICRYVRADGSRESAGHCRHGMKYDRHGRPDCTAKAGNISGRIGIHDRPEKADESGKPAGHCRHGMKYGRPDCTAKAGNIPVRTSIHDRPGRTADAPANRKWTQQRAGTARARYSPSRNGQPTSFPWRNSNTCPAFPLCTLSWVGRLHSHGEARNGREAAHAVGTAIRLLLPYRGDGVKTITTYNGRGFPAHGKIMEAMKETAVCFAPTVRSRKVTPENADRLIRQYVPEGTDFDNPGNFFLRKVQAKTNARSGEKLDFSTQKREFFKRFF